MLTHNHRKHAHTRRRPLSFALGVLGVLCVAAGFAAGVTYLAARQRHANASFTPLELGADSLDWRRARHS